MEKNNSYVKGIIGGLLGGLISSIPWILTYVYANMILSLLAIIIAIGVLKGYQMFKGKIDNKLPAIVIIISLLCVTIATLVIIPILVMAKENVVISLENFKLIYSYSEFTSAIIKDYIISIFFTILGISGVVANIKKQINECRADKIDVKLVNNNNLSASNNESVKNMKNIFVKHNALDKTNAIEKEVILEEYKNSDGKQIFNALKLQQIILKYKGKYYFSEKNERSPFSRFLKLYGKIMLWVLIIGIVMTLTIILL